MYLGSNFSENYRLFVPHDRWISKVIIWSDNPTVLDHKRIIVKIDSWSLNSVYPQGHLVRIIGTEGETGTESLLILHEFNVIVKPFS